MKIYQILLSLMITTSSSTILFCSSAKDRCNVSVRRKSHDGTRDGRFGSARDTFNRLGQTYTGVLGLENQVYDLGSDDKAPERWASFGATINNLADAKKWVAAVERKGWALPQSSMKPALDIIQADRQADITASLQEFEKIQRAGSAILVSVIQKQQERIKQDETRHAYFVEEITRISQAKQREFEARGQERLQEDANTIEKIKNLWQTSNNYITAHNKQYPEAAITDTPFISKKKAKEMNPENLARIASVYDAALKQASACNSSISARDITA